MDARIEEILDNLTIWLGPVPCSIKKRDISTWNESMEKLCKNQLPELIKFVQEELKSNDLQDRIEELEYDNGNLTTEIEDMKYTNDDLSIQIDELEEEINKLLEELDVV